ncbi:MAG TPA: cbb3-type cytochrome oxidase assembly protein CcoS [Pseudomonadales bacterium]|nr:cbb3-type cytochrome oxidase assembly protein CcoS [Pseudomonadales bacterium]
MQSFYLIIPVALVFCGLAIVAWLWASNSGQYDDLDREARRILEDENTPARRDDTKP